jgi:predicted N-formylglutamate amidohydrolase
MSAFNLYNETAPGPMILVCDHASNKIPKEYGNLGLAPEEFQRHIAYDIGAKDVSLKVANAFNGPAIIAEYSRLLIDLNRGPKDPTLVMKLSDGAIIPGNRHADGAEVDRRRKAYHEPYHAALADQIQRISNNEGPAPLLVSIHSFTPAWKNNPRPWHIGILWDKDGRMAEPMVKSLAKMDIPAGIDAGLKVCVGDNQPYSGELGGDCMNVHGTQNGLRHVLVELRQDLVADEEGVEVWSDILIASLKEILSN